MYHSDAVIKQLQAHRILAEKFDNTVSGVIDAVSGQASKNNKGAIRLSLSRIIYSWALNNVFPYRTFIHARWCAKKPMAFRSRSCWGIDEVSREIMREFLKKWLISESKFLICTYVPIVSTMLFALLQIYFFPESSTLGVGIFYLCALLYVIYKCR